MYSIIKNVISRGEYDLTAILRKIDILWGEGQISDDERAELTELARNNANVSGSIDVVAKILDLEKRIAALESGADHTQEIEEFKVGKSYYNGDIVSFEGEIYICIAPDGAVCVWSPKDYPAYWEKVNR